MAIVDGGHCQLTILKALEAEGHWENAMACYLRGIEADEFVKAFHQQLIRCYQQQGRTAEAQAASERRKRIVAAARGAVQRP